MTKINTPKGNSLFTRLFAPSERRAARRQRRAEEKRKRHEIDLKMARDLRETGYFNENLPDAIFYRRSCY